MDLLHTIWCLKEPRLAQEMLLHGVPYFLLAEGLYSLCRHSLVGSVLAY